MRIALISDIHANTYALKAVLADAQQRGIDRYAFLGDTVYFGLYPSQVCDLVLDLDPLVLIKGNTDENIEELDQIVPSSIFEEHLLNIAQFTYQDLNEQQRDVVRKAPISVTKNIHGHDIIFCHGSPYSFTEQLLPDAATKTSIAEKVGSEQAELILCGHTHLPGDFTVEGMRVINPGAVGYSFNGDTSAHYAILDISSSTISCTHYHIPWDSTRYIQELQDALEEFPLFESIIYALKNGRPLNNFKKRFSKGEK